jgi:hypothetical protein
VGITLHVFEVENGSIVTHTAGDSIPFGTRNDETGHPTGYGAQYPIGTPIVGDFDPEGEYPKPDIFVTTSQGAVFCFEYDYQADPPLSPKPGWPLLLPDVAREPVLAEMDPDEDPGQVSLVVQCQDGTLHVYDLPRTSEDPFVADWPSYGGDTRNTRGKLTIPSQRTTGFVGDLGTRPSIRRIGPSPGRGPQEIVLSSNRATEIDLGLYDVAGRRARDGLPWYNPSGSDGTSLGWNPGERRACPERALLVPAAVRGRGGDPQGRGRQVGGGVVPAPRSGGRAPSFSSEVFP